MLTPQPTLFTENIIIQRSDRCKSNYNDGAWVQKKKKRYQIQIWDVNYGVIRQEERAY